MPLHDVHRDLRRRRLFVPPGRREPVAHVLLVEARLGLAWAVVPDVPESARIRRDDLVDHDQLIAEPTKLELRVGDDNPTLPGVRRGEVVQRQAAQPEDLRRLRSDLLDQSENVIGSSCPSSAFVVGVNIGSDSC